MTTATAPAVVSTRPSSTRPVWQRYGGGGILIAAILLLVATILEYVYWTADGDQTGTFVVFVIAFSLSLLLYLASMFPLAFGGHGDDGIVGRSIAGKAGSIAFGVLFLAGQALYLLANYFTDAASDFAAANVASIVLAVLQYVAALVASIVIVRAGVARGLARWSLLVATIVGLVFGIIVQTGTSLELTTILYCISTVVQALVGVSYLTAPRKGTATA